MGLYAGWIASHGSTASQSGASSTASSHIRTLEIVVSLARHDGKEKTGSSRLPVLRRRQASLLVGIRHGAEPSSDNLVFGVGLYKIFSLMKDSKMQERDGRETLCMSVSAVISSATARVFATPADVAYPTSDEDQRRTIRIFLLHLHVMCRKSVVVERHVRHQCGQRGTGRHCDGR